MVDGRIRWGVMSAVLAMGLAAWPAGCGLYMADSTSGTDGAQPTEEPEPNGDFVTVRFRNPLVVEAVDVEFYMATEPLENLPDDLFVPEHLLKASIGVAGTGIIQPQKQDAIQLPCSDHLAIGSHGGSFYDNETGEPRGAGTPRWVQEGPVALCGSTVTFEFLGADGSFTTTLTIGY